MMMYFGPCIGDGRCLNDVVIPVTEITTTREHLVSNCKHRCKFIACLNSAVCGNAVPAWHMPPLPDDQLCEFCVNLCDLWPRMARREENVECGVCYEHCAQVMKVPTNCNHMLCEKCYRQMFCARTYKDQGRSVKPCCPFCRSHCLFLS